MSKAAFCQMIAWSVVGCFAASCATPSTAKPSPEPQTNPVEEAATPVPDQPLLPADVHMHIDQPKGHDLETIREKLADSGFERGAALSPGYQVAPNCEATDCPDQRAFTKSMNDWAVSQILPAERVVVMCGVPLGYDWAAEEAERCIRAGGRGVKLHTERVGISLTDAAVQENVGSILKVAASQNVPVLIHVQFKAPEMKAAFALAVQNPDATVIVAHQAGPMIAMLLEAPDNVWTEISGITMISEADRLSLVPLWRAFGVNRVLLGSDWPLLEPAEHLAALKKMGLSEEETALISRKNFDSLFAPASGERAE